MIRENWRDISEALPHLAAHVLKGVEVGSRLGERTVERLHTQTILREPWRREVLVEGRHANVVAQIAETMWVLAGRNDIEWLSHYLPRAKDFSDDGVTWRGGYGPRIRKWFDGVYEPIDQLRHVVDLLGRDRSTRRAVISIYDPAVDAAPGKDIPCNDFLSFISREGHLDLSVFVRSNDLMWGWSGINAFEWSALQEIVAGLLGLRVGSLVFNTTSLHLYDRHWDKAQSLKFSTTSNAFSESPRFAPSTWALWYVDDLIKEWFSIEERLRNHDYSLTEARQIVNDFPEPMLQSWLQVIAWYWTGDGEHLISLEGTRLWAAVQECPKSVHTAVQERDDKPEVEPLVLAHKTAFIACVDTLHREKSAAYGDSWKKRGEQMSIMANIARKVDRIVGGKATADETSADTAVDLLVYLIKYRLWVIDRRDRRDEDSPSNDLGDLTEYLRYLDAALVLSPPRSEIMKNAARIPDLFDDLIRAVNDSPPQDPAGAQSRILVTSDLLRVVFPLARRLWEEENKFADPNENRVWKGYDGA